MNSGDRLGPYTVLAPLGAGGMGVVYRARDERLEREVAIKALPAGSLASGPARKRFRQEALALAKLNHPNIAAVYDVVEQGDADYLVMEYVPGETLADKLRSGPLTAEVALSLGGEIATALQEAHERGVVHRDLKPGNIVVTPAGHAKVLDFGLAKLFSTQDGGLDPALADTDTRGLVGTPLYMSPEQAEGRPVDSRSDLWSLGVILYQALAGETPFQGEGVLSVLQAVARSTPKPLRDVRVDVPAEAVRIVARAMEKDVSRRYQSASDMRRDLSAGLTQLSARGSRPAGTRPIASRVFGAAAAVALAFLATGAVWFYHRYERRHWAREDAIPEMARLKAADLPLAAFLLRKAAERYLPSDPQLALIAVDTRLVSVTSSPPGASVEIQDYLSPNGAWYALGTTPLQKIRIPEGYFRWRVSKTGASPYLAAPVTHGDMSFSLGSESSPAEGMSRVGGGRWTTMIDFIGWLGPYDLPPFDIDRLEVTNREYQRFVDAGGYDKREYWPQTFAHDGQTLKWEAATPLLRDRTGRPGPSNWEGGHYLDGQGELPVSGVSWYEASAYAAYAGKSLPALAQWFQAAPPDLASYVVRLSNYSGSALARPAAFAGLGPYGTYDMAGNVREWIENATSDGRHFILGGAWNSQTYLYADPEALPALDRSPTNGIRCVRNTTRLPETITGLIKTQERDFTKAKPAADDVFRAYRTLYAYDKTPLNTKAEGVLRETADWREEAVSLDAAYGHQRLAVRMFLPKRVRPPFQTVVFFPSARVLFTPDSRTLGDMAFVDYVIQSGRAVAYPIYQGTYERRGDLALPGASHYTGLITERFKDLGRTIDYLGTRPDVDQARLAYLGVSMGAAEGVIYATLVQEKLRAVVFLDGGFFLYTPPPGIDQVDFAPRLQKPVLMVNGRYDFTFSLEKSQRPLFDVLGTPPSAKRHVVLDTPHDVSERRTELVHEVLGWLDRYLGRIE